MAPLLRTRFRLGLALLAQALFWVGLTFAFAALIQMSGWAQWRDAITFSATNWLPWMVLAPGVFWLARRFPVERGVLWRAVPVHVVACVLCCFIFLVVSAYFAPWPRGRTGGEGRGTWERREGSSRDPAAMERLARERHERFAADRARQERAPEPRPETAPGGAVAASEARASAAPERPAGERWSRDSRLVRGPFSSSGSGTRTFIGRFWPPFSGIVLRANVGATVYLIIACLAHVVAYQRRAQERERESAELAAGLARAKLDALRLQLQPHFLFNTLNAISTLVHRDARAADELIGDLSELLRLSLQTAEHEVPLARELELLDRYLAIEQTRLGDRLRIVREIDPSARSILVPTFLLQPLAENAIRHGIEPRRAPGTVTIRADLLGGNLRLVVADDGVGLPAVAASGRRGIGILNTEQRLQALHGAAAHLDLTTPDAGGVQVQIVLPARTAASPAA